VIIFGRTLMKVAILHPSLNIGGGSERVCLDIINSLKEKGHDVVLGTFEKTDWKVVERHFGRFAKPNEEIVRPGIFGKFAYGETLNFHLLSLNMPKNCDLTIISCVSPWFYCHPAKNIVIYMIPPIGYQNGLRWLYLKPYILMQNKCLKKAKNKVLLTNSSFSATIIKNMYSTKPEVLHPPVNIKNFHPSKKEDLIVSVGRLSPFKRFEVLLKSLVNLDEGKCIIIGSVPRNTVGETFTYIRKLRKMIIDLRLQEKVRLLVNCSFDLLRDTFSKAKLYVHCAMFEHFGISIAEGMASGCVPIVHRSGGPYTDIIDHDKFGFSFKDVSELTNKISLLLKNDDLYKEYSKKAIKRSKLFSREIFKKRMLDIVESKF
jgi:glycosyltransferase involved in cell wall biosynthesis